MSKTATLLTGLLLAVAWLLVSCGGGDDAEEVTNSPSQHPVSREDLDGDGFRNEIEQLAGSDPEDSKSQPEFVGNSETCSDNLDNDLDDSTDNADEGCIDVDGDTIPNFLDNCPRTKQASLSDYDEDGQGDVCDEDDDGDGVADATDECGETERRQTVDGAGCADRQVDWDGDLVCDPSADSLGPSKCSGSDNCDDVANRDQADDDNDLLGDVCDNCPSLSNDQIDSDFDGQGDACDSDFDNEDSDEDGIGDENDHCPNVSDPLQANSDEDWHGDACDNCPEITNYDQIDEDADGFGTLCDNCQTISNEAQGDSDDDGVGNTCDNCPESPNPAQADTDNDAFGDACEAVANIGPGRNSDSLLLHFPHLNPLRPRHLLPSCVLPPS